MERTVVPAEDADLDVLARVIAAAFHDLPPSQWLIYAPASRREIFPGYFRVQPEHALAHGAVYTTPGRTAAALWIPAGEDAPPYNGEAARLDAVTGAWAGRFPDFEATLDQHHPAGIAHVHLAALAVRPDRQHHGTGTALLRHGHQLLDRAGSPAYLEAASTRTRDLYLAHGYVPLPGAPLTVPHGGGAAMWPMWREPGAPFPAAVSLAVSERSAVTDPTWEQM